MVCVDASLVNAWLLPEALSERAIRLREDLRAAGESFIAPALLTLEVTSTLRLAVHRGRVALDYGEDALEAFKLFPIEIHDPRSLVDLAWAWGKAVGAPRLYDMFYLALAEREACDLWTGDRRLLNLVGDRSDRIRWVGDLEEAPS